MKMPSTAFRDPEAKAVAFAAVLVILAGLFAVVRPGEARIGVLRDENERLAQRVDADERSVARSPQVEAELHRIARSLQRFRIADDRTALVARFVREAALTARAHHVEIVALAAAPPRTLPLAVASVAPSPAPSLATAAPLAISRRIGANLGPPTNDVPAHREAIALDLTLEGAYADVLAATRALSLGSVPVSIELASLALKNAAAHPTLDASLRISLERLSASEVPHVPAHAP